jgi:hypothetical protein
LRSKLKPSFFAAFIGFASLTSGCANVPFDNCTPPRSVVNAAPAPSYQPTVQEFHQKIKITAVGYGASSSYDGYTPGQKRLMAMRTSKLDAYRALAEQVQGVKVSGNSTVSAMVAQVDSFRVFVDAYLRGAQVLTVTAMTDGNYETTMELMLDEHFYNGFNNGLYERNNRRHVIDSNITGSVGPGFAYGNNFYYSE